MGGEEWGGVRAVTVLRAAQCTKSPCRLQNANHNIRDKADMLVDYRQGAFQNMTSQPSA